MKNPNASACVASLADEIDLKQSAVPQLCDLIRMQIIRGELRPGTRLLRTRIAARFGVSRQPVSDACARLAEEGLVDVLPQRGTYVSRIDVRAVMSARFVREAVEVEISRRLATERPTAMLDECNGLLDEQSRETNTADPMAFMALDDAFHRLLADAAGQAASWHILQPLKTQMDRLRHITAREFPRQLLLEQHKRIVAAIGRKDETAAETAMRDHLRQIFDDLPRLIEAKPAYFDVRGGAL